MQLGVFTLPQDSLSTDLKKIKEEMGLIQNPNITDASILETMCFIQRHHVPLNVCANYIFTTIAGFLRGVPIMMSDKAVQGCSFKSES